MRIHEVARSLVGAVVVYVSVVTCSSSGDSAQPQVSGHGGGGGADTGAAGLAGEPGDDAASDGAGGLDAKPDVSADATGDALADGPGATDGDDAADGGLVDALVDALLDPVPEALADANESGSRLKARRRIAADGAREFVGWYDSQRNEECAFTNAADGAERCLPSDPALVVPRDNEVAFADAACTQRLVALDADCQAPTYARTETTTGAICSSTALTARAIYQVGSPVGPTYYHFEPVEGGTACVVCDTCADGFYSFYALGAEVPATAFVAATTQTDP